MYHLLIKKDKNPVSLRIKFFDNDELVGRLDFKANLHGQKVEDLPNFIKKEIQNKRITHAAFSRVIVGIATVPIKCNIIHSHNCDWDKDKFVKECIAKILNMLGITKDKSNDAGRELE